MSSWNTTDPGCLILHLAGPDYGICLLCKTLNLIYKFSTIFQIAK